MENKPASLLVVPLVRAVCGIPPSWCGNRWPASILCLNTRFYLFLGRSGHKKGEKQDSETQAAIKVSFPTLFLDV